MGNRIVVGLLGGARSAGGGSGAVQRCEDLDERHRAAGRALNQRHREPQPEGHQIELRALPGPAVRPLQYLLGQCGYALREEGDHFAIVGTNVLLHHQTMRGDNVAELFGQVMRMLEGPGLVVYRGIARFHRMWPDALNGVAAPLGAGDEPGGFGHTIDSRYIPFSVYLDAAVVAARSRRGGSNVGYNASLDTLPGFDRLPANAVCGLVLGVRVRRAASVVFYNVGELQLRGPVPCQILQSFSKDEMTPQ